jgi:hypothetical protein
METHLRLGTCTQLLAIVAVDDSGAFRLAVKPVDDSTVVPLQPCA